MTLQRILLRFFIAIFMLNSSGLVFSAEQFLDGSAHETEYAATAGADGDCANNLAACKAHCQSHCAQHFTVLPSDIRPSPAVTSIPSALPELVSLAPDTLASPLFRPPRTATL